MGRVGAFLQVERVDHDVRPAHESILDFDEFALPLTLDEQREQASRCMNCGVAFCQSGIALGGSAHAVGCPLHNQIPETNDLLYQGRIDDAIARLSMTNPFPEFTGRVCPAPCETACNLGLHKAPVSINDNERTISDQAWARGMEPLAKPAADAPLVSVIGSGPAGLAVAWEMARRGWRIRVYEKADRPGGLLMYGIPNMKLPKDIISRRVDLMRESGIEFNCGVDATTCADEIAAASDAVVIACGSGVARDVALPGRDLESIHFALEYLSEVTSALIEDREANITAKDKNVVVIGGGDTGNDCVACALRQGAASVTQVIRAQEPPLSCNTQEIWPAERTILTQGYGQREAAEIFGGDPRIFSTDTIAFSAADPADASQTTAANAVAQVHIQDLSYDGGRHLVEGTEATIPAQLVLIAKGFTGADPAVFEAFGVEPGQATNGSHCLRAAQKDANGTPANEPAIFVAGDALLGSTLVVNAMADALDCATELASTFPA